MIRSCRNLTQLHAELLEMGYTLSRSGTYLHLLPRRANSIEGKRHINTVPVQLRRAKNDLHRRHPDTEFATATLRNSETLASVLGPQQVTFISQDDKARVPLGITAANKETPLLMHLEYRVRFSDHDWVVSERHKLIPSVYAGIVIQEQGMGRPDAVTYSGPTYIAIRSGKHSSSTAGTHLDRLLSLEVFKDLTKTAGNKSAGEATEIGVRTNRSKTDDEIKPIMIITVDGGPDETPRYTNVINYAIKHFIDYDLDALYITTNAPGRSAYTRIERRMAPLSRQLAGLILPHEHFGSHLNSRGITVDEALEKDNFEHAGNVLSGVWNNIAIDGHDVMAEYKSPEEILPQIIEKSSEWYARHVRESQYFLQIVKCDEVGTCCKKARSGLKTVLRDGFFPAPFPLWQTASGLVVPDLVNCKTAKFAPLFIRLSVDLKPENNVDRFKIIPYDLYYPSVQVQLDNRVCKSRGLYFASQKSMKLHAKYVHFKSLKKSAKTRPVRVAARWAQELMCVILDSFTQSEDVEWLAEEEVDNDVVTIPDTNMESTPLPAIDSMKNWIECR